MRGSRRGGGPNSLENRNAKGFLINTGQDPLEITKLTSQHSMLGHYWPTRETTFNYTNLNAILLTFIRTFQVCDLDFKATPQGVDGQG